MLATSPQVTWDSQKSTLYQRLDVTRAFHTARRQALPHMCSLSKPWWHYFSIYWWTTGIYGWSGLALCKFARAIIRGEEIMSVITDWKQQQKSISPQFSRPEVPGIYVVTLPEPVSFGGRWQTSPDVLAHIFFSLHVSFSFIFVKIILGFTLKYSLKSSHL